MKDILAALRDLIQEDINQRGLAADPVRNLINACPDDFRQACYSLADSASRLAVVTGFFIPTATPPCGETDGPLGALFLARALVPLGIRVALLTDDFCVPALRAGLAACALERQVALVELPPPATAHEMTPADYTRQVLEQAGQVTHLLAIERVGPSHTLDAVPPEHRDRCHTMRGRDVTAMMSPAHYLFEVASAQPGLTTIGIGDGGNEIGMGKIPWETIRRNITHGGLIACRVPTDHLLVCGISNWGAYALAAGVAVDRGVRLDACLFDGRLEREILQAMVEQGPLVDGVVGRPVATIDGLAWDRYAELLGQIGKYAI